MINGVMRNVYMDKKTERWLTNIGILFLAGCGAYMVGSKCDRNIKRSYKKYEKETKTKEDR